MRLKRDIWNRLVTFFNGNDDQQACKDQIKPLKFSQSRSSKNQPKKKQRVEIEKNSIKQNFESSVYDIDGDRDLIIINISQYEKMSQYHKSEEDMKLLIKAFNNRKFKIFEPVLTGFVSEQDVRRKFETYLRSNGKPKLFSVVLLAKGADPDSVEFSNGDSSSIYDIIDPLVNSNKLSNVPKIVIVQICKNSSLYSFTFDSDFEQSDNIRLNKFSQLDTIQFFGSTFFNLSTRDKINGASPFINEFCRVFQFENNALNMILKLNINFARQKFLKNYRYRENPFPQSSHTLCKELIF